MPHYDKHIWKRRAKVTIAIGMIPGNEDRILMACDSQTTYGSAKDLSTKKLSVVYFANSQMLVAQAGTADLAQIAIENIQRKAILKRLEHTGDAADLVQEAVREVRNYLTEVNKNCITTEDGWRRYFYEENYFELLIGFFCHETPYMFRINIDWALCVPVQTPFTAIGIGKPFAESIMRDYMQADPILEFGGGILVSVVKKTVENVDGCSMPIWMGSVYPRNQIDGPAFETRAMVYDSRPVDIILDQMKSHESKENAQRRKHLRGILKKATEVLRKELDKEERKNETKKDKSNE